MDIRNVSVTHPSRVELNTVWQLVVAEASHTLASFGVPQLDVTVVASADKICSIVVETDVLHSLAMACVHTYWLMMLHAFLHVYVHTYMYAYIHRCYFTNVSSNASSLVIHLPELQW